jgi:bifunctional non-homologous end joining protein LigD
MPANRFVSPSSARHSCGLPQVDPIVLVPRVDPFDDPEWVFEPKYDGFRGVVYATAHGCEIRSRRDIPLERFRDLWDRIGEVLRRRQVILDGEIVSLNRQGKPVFEDLRRGEGYVAFAAFDLLWLDGTDLRTRSLAERKALLADLLPEDTGRLYKILTIEEHGRALFGAIRKMDLEGIVAKRKSDPYASRTTWYRIRNPEYTQSEGRGDRFRRREPARSAG